MKSIALMDPLLSKDVGGHGIWIKLIAKYSAELTGAHIVLGTRTDISEVTKQRVGVSHHYAEVFTTNAFSEFRTDISQKVPRQRIAIARDCTVAASKLANCDLQVYPTAMAATALGVAAAKKRSNHTVLLFQYPLEEVSDRDFLYRQDLLSILQNPNKHRIHCLATTEGIAADFSVLGIPCKVAAFGHFAQQKARAPKNQLQHIGILGAQRPEKDGGLLLPLVQALLANKFRVTLQDTRKNKFAFSHPNLQIIDQFLMPDKFHDLAASTDANIITNEPTYFTKRFSGVATESLAAGVPIVAPSTTHMAWMASRFNAGVAYKERTPQSILSAVNQLQKNYTAVAQGAIRSSDWLTSEHGLKNLTLSLLNAVNV